jgi:DNA-binding MarR family transcriptional regulator
VRAVATEAYEAHEQGPAPRLELFYDAALIVENIIERRLAHLRLSLAQARSLILLLHASEAMTPTDVAGLLLQEVQSISSLMSRLEKRGFVLKGAHPLDKRSTILHLTVAGEHAAEASAEAVLTVAKELTGALAASNHLEQLRDFAIAYAPMSLSAYKRRIESFEKQAQSNSLPANFLDKF